MSKTQRLLEKLKNGSIDANELRTLLKQEGWVLDRRKGSHEQWYKEGQIFTLAIHSKDLKFYQIKQAKERLLK